MKIMFGKVSSNQNNFLFALCNIKLGGKSNVSLFLDGI